MLSKASFRLKDIVEVNTISTEQQPQTKDAECAGVDDEKARLAATKLLNLMDTIHMWPEFAVQWLEQNMAKGVDGIQEIARTLADDRQNSQGLRDESPAQKERIFNLMFEQRFAEQLQTNWDSLKAKREAEDRTTSEQRNTSPGGYFLYVSVKTEVLASKAGA